MQVRPAQREDASSIARIHVETWQAAYVSARDMSRGLSIAARQTEFAISVIMRVILTCIHHP
ncbi:hypothetical protein BH10PSE17_BH10PSE17_08740 [soil metagenome]